MADEQPYKAIIAPSSKDSDLLDECENFDDAMKVYKREVDTTSICLFEYATIAELQAFVDGFNAGLGWLGEGPVITNIEIDG